MQKKRKRVNLLCDWILFYVLVTLHCVLWSEHTTCLWQMFIKEWPDARSRWRPCGWCQNISTSDLIAIWTGPRHSDSDKDLTWASRASQISSSVSSASFSCSHAREPSQRRWELKLVFFFELSLTTWVFWGRHVWEEVVIYTWVALTAKIYIINNIKCSFVSKARTIKLLHTSWWELS